MNHGQAILTRKESDLNELTTNTLQQLQQLAEKINAIALYLIDDWSRDFTDADQNMVRTLIKILPQSKALIQGIKETEKDNKLSIIANKALDFLYTNLGPDKKIEQKILHIALEKGVERNKFGQALSLFVEKCKNLIEQIL